MAAKKSETAIVKIADFLSTNLDSHDLEAVCAAARVAKSTAQRTLAKLVDSGAVATADSDGTVLWRWANPVPDPETGESQESEAAATDEVDEGGRAHEAAREPDSEAGEASTAETGPTAQNRDEESGAEAQASDAEDTAPAEADAGTTATGGDSGEQESEAAATDAAGVRLQPVLLEHDPMVMYMARALADATGPLTTRQVAEAAYMPMGTREVLTALRALHAAELATCSKPFTPTDEDCTWQRASGLEPDAFMRSARSVPMSAAPDKVTCPTCGHSAAIPGVTKPRKRGGDLRSDGSRKLPAGGLKRLAKAWLTRPENAGERVTPGQLKRELRAEHGDQVSRNCDGALRQLMADQFTKEDPTDADKRPLLVELEGVTPLTYRVRDLA